MLKYLMYRAITFISTTLPRPLLYWVALRIADLNYAMDPRGREAVKANLRVILGEDAPKEIVTYEARWTFRSFGYYMGEFFGYRRFGDKFIDQHIAMRGREHIDEALKRGRGLIVCSGHYSNWELGAAMLVRLGYRITAVGQMHADPRVNAMFAAQRASRGYNLITEHSATAALRALRDNHILLILGDRMFGGTGVEVEFFGKKTVLPQGPFRLALSSGAPLVPSVMSRRMNRNFTLDFQPPLQVPSDGTTEAKVLALAQAWARYFEEVVRRDPCQWAVFFRVWDDERTGEPGHAQSMQAPLRTARRILEVKR